jgi:hypothetical protein
MFSSDLWWELIERSSSRYAATEIIKQLLELTLLEHSAFRMSFGPDNYREIAFHPARSDRIEK